MVHIIPVAYQLLRCLGTVVGLWAVAWCLGKYLTGHSPRFPWPLGVGEHHQGECRGSQEQ